VLQRSLQQSWTQGLVEETRTEEDTYELIVNTEETFDEEKSNFDMEDHDKLDYEAEEPEKAKNN